MTKRLYLSNTSMRTHLISRYYTVFLFKFYLHLEKQSLVGDKMSITIKVGIVRFCLTEYPTFL